MSNPAVGGGAAPSRTPVLVGLLLFALTLRGPFVVVSTVTDELNTELGMSASAIGLLTSLPVLCFGLAAPGASALIARLGVERSVLTSLLGTLIGVLVRSVGGVPGALIGIKGLASSAQTRTVLPTAINCSGTMPKSVSRLATLSSPCTTAVANEVISYSV